MVFCILPSRVHFLDDVNIWTLYLKEIMLHFLDCGDLHAGFVPIRCDACGTERLLAFSCKERKFCFFLQDRKWRVELSRCGWETLKAFLQATVPEPEPVPAAGVSTQTYGDYPDRFHPHLHVLCTDGCFCGQGLFRVAPKFELKDLEKLFRLKVLSMLLRNLSPMSERMRFVAAIENPEGIRRILEHLGLWLANTRPTPSAHSPLGLRPLHQDSHS